VTKFYEGTIATKPPFVIVGRLGGPRFLADRIRDGWDRTA